MRDADVMRPDIVAFDALGVVLKDLECIGNRLKAMDCRPFTSGRDIDREHSDIRSNIHIAPIVGILDRFVIVASSGENLSVNNVGFDLIQVKEARSIRQDVSLGLAWHRGQFSLEESA